MRQRDARTEEVTTLLTEFIVRFRLLGRGPAVSSLPAVETLRGPVLVRQRTLLGRLALVERIRMTAIFFVRERGAGD